MPNEIANWEPKGAKAIKWTITGLLGATALTAVAFGVVTVVPTWVAALALIQQLFTNGIYMIGTGVVLGGVIWGAYEIFSPNGKINGLLAQGYSSAINAVAWELLNIDPISPLLDKRGEMVSKKGLFDEAFANFDGTISHLRETQDRYLQDAIKVERNAKAAEKMRAEDPSKEATFQRLAYEAGRYRETAENFARMQMRLEPVRATISKVQEALGVMISNIDIDIRIARDEWEAQKNMSAMDKAARGILKTSREELANNAIQLIQQKYGESLGRLENLTDLTKPFLESIDLNKASYSEELLTRWNQESQLLIAGPKGEAMPLIAPSVQTPDSAYSKLIR